MDASRSATARTRYKRETLPAKDSPLEAGDSKHRERCKCYAAHHLTWRTIERRFSARHGAVPGFGHFLTHPHRRGGRTSHGTESSANPISKAVSDRIPSRPDCLTPCHGAGVELLFRLLNEAGCGHGCAERPGASRCQHRDQSSDLPGARQGHWEPAVENQRHGRTGAPASGWPQPTLNDLLTSPWHGGRN